MKKISFIQTETNLKIDRLSLCYAEPDPENVKATENILLHESISKTWPGMITKPGGLFRVKAVLSLPFETTAPDRATAIFFAGPKVPSHPSYRLEFNPARLCDQGWSDLWTFLQTTMDPEPKAFMNGSKVTRIDLAVDLPGLDVEQVIVQTSRKRKVGVYSDQTGRPQTVYLGAPTGRNRLAAYTKTDKDSGAVSLRIECRVNARCAGSELHAIENPFASISLLPVSLLDKISLGMPPVFLADSIRLRGLSRALKLLPPTRRKMVEYSLSAGEALLPDADDIWAEFPKALEAAGFNPG